MANGTSGTNLGEFLPNSLADLNLSSNADYAFSLANGAPLLGSTFQTNPATWTNLILTGTSFAVVPEPTSLGLLGILSVGMLGRRRRRAC